MSAFLQGARANLYRALGLEALINGEAAADVAAGANHQHHHQHQQNGDHHAHGAPPPPQQQQQQQQQRAPGVVPIPRGSPPQPPQPSPAPQLQSPPIGSGRRLQVIAEDAAEARGDGDGAGKAGEAPDVSDVDELPPRDNASMKDSKLSSSSTSDDDDGSADGKVRCWVVPGDKNCSGPVDCCTGYTVSLLWTRG